MRGVGYFLVDLSPKGLDEFVNFEGPCANVLIIPLCAIQVFGALIIFA